MTAQGRGQRAQMRQAAADPRRERRTAEPAPLDRTFKKSTLREYFESIVIAVILALFIRTFVVQAFKIPTGSMEENLLIGDHLLVNKFVFGPVASPLERATTSSDGMIVRTKPSSREPSARTNGTLSNRPRSVSAHGRSASASAHSGTLVAWAAKPVGSSATVVTASARSATDPPRRVPSASTT